MHTVAPAAPVWTPGTIPAHARAYYRRAMRGLRFADGRTLVRELIRIAAQARGRRLDAVEVARCVVVGRAVWHEVTPSPLGGRAF